MKLVNKSFPIICFLFFSVSAIGQKAYTVETVPNPKNSGTGYVSDPDKFLTNQDVANLNTILTQLEDSATAQVAIVMLGSIGEQNPKEFATALFNHWGIGQADNDNGLLIISVMDQRRTEFETGYGMEAVLPDAICYRIGMQELVPHYKVGNYGTGLLAAVTRIKNRLESPQNIEEIRSEGRPQPNSPIPGMPLGLFWYLLAAFIFGLCICIWVIITLWNKEDLYDKYRSIFKVYGWWYGIAFPIPYFLIMIVLRQQLRKLRNQPRFSKLNGKVMHKMSEEEEDRFLKAGQVKEEEIGSVDYDVWVTEEEDDVLILRYARRFSKYKKCKQCNFKTFHLEYSKTISHATEYSTGKKLHRYECKNCSYADEVITTIPKISSSSGGGGGGWSGGGGGSSSWGGGSSGGGGAGVSW